MRHPGDIELALFAGGDLGFVERWRVQRHVRTCSGCRSDIEALRGSREQLRDVANELPQGLNWTRLSQEMTGNIRVGLAAGECVGPEPREPKMQLGWHAAVVMAAAFVIGVGAMWWKMPSRSTIPMPPRTSVMAVQDGVVIEATQAAIGVKANGAAMSFLNSHSDSVAVTVSMQGSARAQFVNADTGQVTINKVFYAQ